MKTLLFNPIWMPLSTIATTCVLIYVNLKLIQTSESKDPHAKYYAIMTILSVCGVMTSLSGWQSNQSRQVYTQRTEQRSMLQQQIKSDQKRLSHIHNQRTKDLLQSEINNAQLIIDRLNHRLGG